jgi:hypothetical protein
MKTLQWLSLTVLTSALIGACGGDEALFGPSVDDLPGTGAGSPSGNNTGAGNPAAPGTIVINEIMYDPSAVSDELGEWLELYNPTDAAINMMGWVLRDNGNNNHVIDALIIEPGHYAVLARSGNTLQNGAVLVDYAYGDDIGLANAGDTVLLENVDGDVIDSVTYQAGGEWPAATKGISIELEAESFDNSMASNWVHAVVPYGDGDLGTPGAPNGGTLPTWAVDESVVSWHNPDLKVSVAFTPLDDAEQFVLQHLSKATQSIEIAFFNVRLDTVKDLLVLKKNAGVDVHVVLDKKQQDKSYNTMGEELSALGINVSLVENTAAENATMHNKFAIVDSHLVMTGSANYSYTALNISDEELIAFDDAGLAARYELELDEIIQNGDVSSAPYAGNEAMQVFMGPEDGLAYKVKDMLDDAQTSVVVAMFQLNIQMIVDALVAAHVRGVNVIVVLDEKQASQADATADETLSAAGVPVLLADATGNSVAEMHSKFVVVDHAKVLLGSYNWTNLGSFFNDENIVILDDVHMATRFEGRAASLLNDYNAPAPATMGLTTGMQAVSFDVTNVALDVGVTLHAVGGPFGNGVELNGTTISVDIAAGTRVDYHYEIRSEGATLAIEGGSHTFTVPYAPGPFAVRDAYMD